MLTTEEQHLWRDGFLVSVSETVWINWIVLSVYIFQKSLGLITLMTGILYGKSEMKRAGETFGFWEKKASGHRFKCMAKCMGCDESDMCRVS